MGLNTLQHMNLPSSPPAAARLLSPRMLGRLLVALYALHFVSGVFIGNRTTFDFLPWGLVSLGCVAAGFAGMFLMVTRPDPGRWPARLLITAALLDAVITTAHLVLSWQAGWYSQAARALVLVLFLLLLAVSTLRGYTQLWLGVAHRMPHRK